MTRNLLKSLAFAATAAGAVTMAPVATAAPAAPAALSHAPVVSDDGLAPGGDSLSARPSAVTARQSLEATPQIVGGQQAENPSVVQLSFGQNGGTYGCTGEVIAPEYVLTAQHCTDGDQWMDVYVSNDVQNPGTPIAADTVWGSPNGDVGLVHLSQPVDVPAVTLTDSYTPSAGEQGLIQGYGLRANQEPTDYLYEADVEVLGESADAYQGPAIHVQGIDGASNHGDSGGPLFINNEVVGVCSTGDTADPGDDIHAGSNYANLTASRDWITQISGV